MQRRFLSQNWLLASACLFTSALLAKSPICVEVAQPFKTPALGDNEASLAVSGLTLGDTVLFYDRAAKTWFSVPKSGKYIAYYNTKTKPNGWLRYDTIGESRTVMSAAGLVTVDMSTPQGLQEAILDPAAKATLDSNHPPKKNAWADDATMKKYNLAVLAPIAGPEPTGKKSTPFGNEVTPDAVGVLEITLAGPKKPTAKLRFQSSVEVDLARAPVDPDASLSATAKYMQQAALGGHQVVTDLDNAGRTNGALTISHARYCPNKLQYVNSDTPVELRDNKTYAAAAGSPAIAIKDTPDVIPAAAHVDGSTDLKKPSGN